MACQKQRYFQTKNFIFFLSVENVSRVMSNELWKDLEGCRCLTFVICKLGVCNKRVILFIICHYLYVYHV